MFDKITKLRSLGIKYDEATMWALVIEADKKRIVASSDFDKVKLSKIFDAITSQKEKYGFEIEIKE